MYYKATVIDKHVYKAVYWLMCLEGQRGIDESAHQKQI